MDLASRLGVDTALEPSSRQAQKPGPRGWTPGARRCGSHGGCATDSMWNHRSIHLISRSRCQLSRASPVSYPGKQRRTKSNKPINVLTWHNKPSSALQRSSEEPRCRPLGILIRLFDIPVVPQGNVSNPPRPSPVLVRTTEVLGMKNLSENFSRLHQARTRAVEKLVAVGEEHLPLLHGLQPRPQRMSE